ncbi:MAG TPA: c-type cytochrome [Burkholderiaceae bacterium]|nr:c-type cytochrome [Burkholderiaceae bacterium]
MKRIASMRWVVAAASLALPAAVLAQGQSQPFSAQYLAGNCANCHGTLGRSAGAMPSLAGLQKAYFVEQMKLFRDGKRQATIMHQLAKGYTDEQIDMLAEYFARQKAAQ